VALARGGFDVIQCFPSLNYNNTLAFGVAKALGTPIVLCFFDYLDYAGIIAETGRIDPDVLARHEPGLRERWMLRHIDHCFAISNKEIAFLRRYTDRVSYSPVPIELSEYDAPPEDPRPRYGIPPGDFTFLCLGRVSRIKGQDLAVSAFADVAHELPGSRLVVVGRNDYEPAILEEMRATAQRAGIGDRVIFTGQVERAEVLGWLAHADVHVIPVRFMNSGAVVVESWASRTPVIQSDVVDPNLVEPGKNGFLFRSEDTADLARQMRAAVAARDHLDALAERGRALVLERYTYEYLTKLYEETWREIRA
jgi:glycosyltransferase involved in cell wall biosynthesis